MFRVKIPAAETYRNATRPFIFASLRGVLDSFNLNKDVLTFFSDEVEASRMIGTTFSTDLRTDQKTDVGFEERQYVEVEIEDSEVNTDMDSSHRHITNPPVWLEPNTNSMIVPLYETKKVNVTVNRYFPDKVLAERFRTQIRSGLKGQVIQQFSTSIHYPILNQVLMCMETIYKRLVNANIIDSSETDALTWFKSCSKTPCDVISNMIGNNAAFVFKRSVDSVKLMYRGIDIAKVVSKGRYNGQYLVSFEYSFYYAELVEWELYYPIMVYQQMTDPIYIPTSKQEYINPYPESQFFEGLMAFGKERYMSWSAPDIFVFPGEDNWRPPILYKLDAKLQRLALMEDVENQNVLNLFKFNGEETFWNDNFKSYLKQYHSKVTTRHRNPLYLTLWSNNVQVLEEQVSMDEDGNIYLNRKPVMANEYRVVLFFDYDVSKYTNDAIDDIISCDNETIGRWIMGVLFPYLPLPGDAEYSGPTPEGVCPWLDWNDDVIDKLTPDREGGGGNNSGNGSDNSELVKIHQADALIIAKNESFNRNNTPPYLLDYTASEYLRRK